MKIGLLRQEVHVWFYTPKGEIIFQLRAKDKDTFPGLLDSTAGGHVEIGDNYETSAVKEVEEETGLKLRLEQLTFIRIQRRKYHDTVTGLMNNVLRALYVYRYDRPMSDLRIEVGKAQGFEAIPLATVFSSTVAVLSKFIPSLFGDDWQTFFKEVENYPRVYKN